MADTHFLMEKREEFMVSPTNSHSVVVSRTAHFLTPSVTSIDGPAASPPPDFLNPAASSVAKYKDLPFKAIFNGWRYPQKKWKSWVDRMYSLHHSTWKKAGIFQAIMNSTFTVHRNEDLIFAFAEKWCAKTNTLVFPWGEATITLEDMIVIGGYSVLGDSVFTPPGNGEMEETVKKLDSARWELIRSSSAKKAEFYNWMSKFMGSESEIEHEAFLAFWLARFVFPIFPRNVVGKNVLSIAVNLARGNKIALAPAVLACIYRNMSLLKAAVTAARIYGTMEGQNSVLEIVVSAPLALVQVWVWERFPKLRPKNPNSVRQGKPRFARWHKLKKMNVKDVMQVIDSSSAENFQWRPYNNVDSSKMVNYKDDGYWAVVDSEEIERFVRCLRTSELVGLEADCIEQYLPHRVAMQFGMDQDIPGHVERVNSNLEIAWSYYTRHIRDGALIYVPGRVSEPGFTIRYLIWWKELRFGQRDGKTITCKEETGGEKRKEPFGRKSKESELIIPPPNRKRVETGASGDLRIVEKLQDRKKLNLSAQEVFERKCNEAKNIGPCGETSSKSSKREFTDSPPHGFALKHSQGKERDLGSGSKKTATEIFGGDERFQGVLQSQEDNSPGTNHLSSTADNMNIRQKEPSTERAESGLKNDAGLERSHGKEGDRMIGEDDAGQARSRNFESCGMELEERVTRLEKLCALLKSGKLDCFLRRKFNGSIGN